MEWGGLEGAGTQPHILATDANSLHLHSLRFSTLTSPRILSSCLFEPWNVKEREEKGRDMDGNERYTRSIGRFLLTINHKFSLQVDHSLSV